MKEKSSFEEQMQQLESVVNKLEGGDVPLDQTMNYFKQGVGLSNELQKRLTNAKTTFAKIATPDGQEVPYDRDKNGQDIDNDE